MAILLVQRRMLTIPTKKSAWMRPMLASSGDGRLLSTAMTCQDLFVPSTSLDDFVNCSITKLALGLGADKIPTPVCKSKPTSTPGDLQPGANPPVSTPFISSVPMSNNLLPTTRFSSTTVVTATVLTTTPVTPSPSLAIFSGSGAAQGAVVNGVYLAVAAAGLLALL